VDIGLNLGYVGSRTANVGFPTNVYNTNGVRRQSARKFTEQAAGLWKENMRGAAVSAGARPRLPARHGCAETTPMTTAPAFDAFGAAGIKLRWNRSIGLLCKPAGTCAAGDKISTAS
jgi:hypothetical protein